MQSRVKNFQNRIGREIQEQEGLLEDIEQVRSLKLEPLVHPKKRLVSAADFTVRYGVGDPVFAPLTFEVQQGEKVFLQGENGSGKSTVIKSILSRISETQYAGGRFPYDLEAFQQAARPEGTLQVAGNMIVSYIDQDTTGLTGSLRAYAAAYGLDITLFFTLLRYLDFERVQFEKDLQDLSEGQKKKVLIAASLMTPAHLYIWDEPMNYIDVFSRMQIEELLGKIHPTMIIVEHDVRFAERFADKVVRLGIPDES
ncbi:MAG: ATP-binding cassette domain-containing protein [Clostridiales bacterium]|nr:ATP-binding cassette domain-containing protein [Clostridiales bacterium]